VLTLLIGLLIVLLLQIGGRRMNDEMDRQDYADTFRSFTPVEQAVPADVGITRRSA